MHAGSRDVKRGAAGGVLRARHSYLASGPGHAHILGMRRGRTVLVLFGVVAVFNAVVFPTIARRLTDVTRQHMVAPLDLKLSYTPDEAYATIGTLAPDARRFYVIVETTVDILYPMVYALFFYLLTRWLLDRSPARVRWVDRATVIPFAAMIADWLENTGIVVLVDFYPTRLDPLAWLTSGVTTTKWVCLVLTGALLLYAAVRALLSRRGRATVAP